MSSAALPFWSLIYSQAGPDACWPWLGTTDANGYGIWGQERAHRVAYCQGHDRVLTPWAVVRHTCDYPGCCNPRHLLAGTQAMNVADRVRRGRSAAGLANGRNVLGEFDVLAIYHSNESLAVAAARFGVSKWTARDIRTGRIWGWLTGANSYVGNETTAAVPKDRV